MGIILLDHLVWLLLLAAADMNTGTFLAATTEKAMIIFDNVVVSNLYVCLEDVYSCCCFFSIFFIWLKFFITFHNRLHFCAFKVSHHFLKIGYHFVMRWTLERVYVGTPRVDVF